MLVQGREGSFIPFTHIHANSSFRIISFLMFFEKEENSTSLSRGQFVPENTKGMCEEKYLGVHDVAMNIHI